ncbi:MAG: PqqD family protein [Myxococcota bacterium]
MSEQEFRRNPHTAGRIIDGLAFVVTPDNNKLHTLNTTATYLWELAKEGCTAAAAADHLVSRYQVERDTALRDAEVCLRDLVVRQILIAVP